MPEQDQEVADQLLEECIDELDAAVEKLAPFPIVVLAFAMRAHLAALLQALAVEGGLSRTEIRAFLAGLEGEA